MNEAHTQDDAFTDYVMGTLHGDAALALEAHASGCTSCATKLAAEARLEEQLFAFALKTKSVVPKETPVQWRPNAAAALSALAEIATTEEEKPAPVPDPALAGLPDIAPQQPKPNETVWRFERPAKKQRWPVGAVVAVSSSIAAVCVAAIGLLVYPLLTKPAVQFVPVPQTQTPPPPVVAQQPVTPPPTVVQPTLNTPPPPVVKHTPSAKKGKPVVAMNDPPPAKKEEKDGFDDLINNNKKKPVDVKQTLGRDDVLGTVKANAGSVTKCADAYTKSGGTLPAKIMVKWVIKPSGNTEGVEMATPELKGTPLESCVVAAVKKWKFPEFASGTIPVTFPFAVAQ